MKAHDSREELLADVLREDGLEAFKASLHKRCLAQLDRKRRLYTVPLVLVAAAAVLVIMLRLFFDTSGDGPLSGTPAAASTPWLVRTTPLAAHQIVTTPPSGSSVEIVLSQRHGDVAVSAPLSRVDQDDDSTVSFSRIDDEGLLAMFDETPRALISTPDGGRILKFLDPLDAARFLAVMK